MKRIEDIEAMETDELESAALSEDIHVPEGLEERIKACLAVQQTLDSAADRPHGRRASFAAIAVAASLAALVIIPKKTEAVLEDTFSDPYLAYAQVETTFQKISDKMAAGVSMAVKAGEAAEKPVQIIHKINEQ